MQHCKYYLIPAFGDVKLSKLTTHMIQRYYNSLINPAEGKALSGKTVKNINGTFSKALSKAVELGEINRNPCSAVTLPRVERKEKPEFSIDTVKAVIADFPELTFHNLRNAFADISIISGDDPKTLQSSLGHSTAKLSLEVYSNINDDLRRGHAERLENLINTKL